MKLRINAGDKDAGATQDKAIGKHMGISLSFLSILKCWTVWRHITKWDSRTDYVMNLSSTITTESSIHRKPMPHIKLQTYPWNMRLLLNLPLQDLSKLNMMEWCCCMTEFSDHRKIIVNKSDATWNWSSNTPCKLLKGILVLFEEEKPYVRDTSKFYNPKLQKSL